MAGIGDLSTVPRLPTLGKGVGKVRGRSLDRATLRAASRFPNVVKGQAWGPSWSFFDEGDPDIVFAADRFHASAVGHATFAFAVEPVIDELLASLGERTRGPCGALDRLSATPSLPQVASTSRIIEVTVPTAFWL